MNKLIFEGAGWDKAENNNVGNCRIRTKILNKKGQIIYLELGGHKNTNYKGFVSHCFNMDDEKTNYTQELNFIEKLKFKYNKTEILKIVNKYLDCYFDDIIVINNGVNVHANKIKYLCKSN